MKRIAFWCLVGLVALVFGCGKKDTVIRLDKLPETDLSALNPYVEWQPAEISADRLWVNLKGKAKVNLGPSLRVKVTRFTAAGRLDTVFAQVIPGSRPDSGIPGQPGSGDEGAGAIPAPTAPPGASGTGEAGSGDLPPELVPIPSPKPIEAGDEVAMQVDATTDKGVVTKLVFVPMASQ